VVLPEDIQRGAPDLFRFQPFTNAAYLQAARAVLINRPWVSLAGIRLHDNIVVSGQTAVQGDEIRFAQQLVKANTSGPYFSIISSGT